TSPSSDGPLQWLTPEQTAGKAEPYPVQPVSGGWGSFSTSAVATSSSPFSGNRWLRHRSSSFQPATARSQERPLTPKSPLGCGLVLALGFVLQAHHCRSMIPCQDSPSVKHTYYAQVTAGHTYTHPPAPPPLPPGAGSPLCPVLRLPGVGAEGAGGGDERHRGRTGGGPRGQRPPGLQVQTAGPDPVLPDGHRGGGPGEQVRALRVGVSQRQAHAALCRVIGPRSRVWSEKELVEKAASEFSQVSWGPGGSRGVQGGPGGSAENLSGTFLQTETMLKTAEDLVGPYVWGQYDILVLPPSRIYGGMENPCLTFATPTLLVG
ncbi:unnamed protein product, partial [Tetraodon nigroviridis]